jgi:exonuclease III
MENKYLKKYLKYKNKYLQLQTQIGGNFGMEEKISWKCNEPNKILCPRNSINLGLCTNLIENCNKVEIDGELPSIAITSESERTEHEKAISRGREKGYTDTNLNKSCYGAEDIIVYEHDKKDNIIPKIFSIITLNAMGIIREDNNKKILMKERVKILVEQIKINNPDILCFQEMSSEFYEELYSQIGSIYKFSNPEVLGVIKKDDVTNFIISKYNPIRTKFVKLKGNLFYPNSLGIYEFENLVVFNVYLQAGSVSSLGQKNKWKHYSRCRIHELIYISNIIKEYTKPFVILGDFNFDLNDINGMIFPEIRYLKDIMEKNNCVDSFKHINPTELGLTEDTDINSLRWNDKFEIKKYRYDAIFSANKLKPIESKLFADIPKILDSEENINAYVNVFVKDKINNPKLKYIGPANNKKYELFVSDHFGVLSQFEIV